MQLQSYEISQNTLVKVYRVFKYSVASDFDVKHVLDTMFLIVWIYGLVVRASEWYSIEPGSSSGGGTCFPSIETV